MSEYFITPNYEWYTYDCEVFAYDFIVVFKNKRTGEYFVYHNDNEGVRDFISDNAIYCGFNTKSYDQYILKAICSGLSPEDVKQVNDYCIEHNDMSWQCPLLHNVFYRFNNVDIRCDVRKGLSLKAIEGHLGLDIEESNVDFNIDRPLTPEEIELTIKYCKHDVDATEKLTDIRQSYLLTKYNLGKRAGIGDVVSLQLTNAKLTAKILGAVKRDWHDGRDYKYPENLDLSVIPNEVVEFFDTIHDMSIPDKVLFKTNKIIDIGGMPCKFAWGGVHGSLTGYQEESNSNRVIQNRDVSSLYPSLIEEYNYLSRNVPNPDLFFDIRKERITAKHEGNKQLANDLKLPLNTVSGAQENEFNDLYDPLPTRSMRISGQLFLTVLTVRLLNACPSIKLLNLNTDGLMYSIDKSELPIVDEICKKWETECRFELETDNISKVWLKDVNNLLFVDNNNKTKTVGSYLNYGISIKGAWSINNSMTIVKKAVTEYFVNGTPAEETINNCNDIFEFQIIAKAGSKYKEAYHLVDGVKQPIQKVNRIYATTDTRYGKLFKIKKENNAEAKIESLPEHCIIDNRNELGIESVDKQFYIELAKKRINDYLGIKPEKNTRRKNPMATTTNVYQKLLNARMSFLGKGIKKSGKNMNLAFTYFELEDIVPTVTEIFQEVGLIALTNFSSELATIQIVNTDNPNDSVTFCSPFKQIEPIVSNTGKKATNEMQSLGASITYMRRYLYMIALDICEPDAIDANLTEDKPSVPEVPTLKIVTPAKPETPLTDGNGMATETQVKQLKALLSELKNKDASKEEFIAKIAVETNGFTNLTKADCEKLTIKVSEMIKGGE